MNYEKVIINTLDSFGVSRSYTGYNYVVYGLLLILEDSELLRISIKRCTSMWQNTSTPTGTV